MNSVRGGWGGARLCFFKRRERKLFIFTLPEGNFGETARRMSAIPTACCAGNGGNSSANELICTGRRGLPA